MATGITKNAWDGSTHVISSEYFPYDTSYELTYKGKSSEDEILKGSVSEKYESIYGKHTDNKLFYGYIGDCIGILLNKQMKKEFALVTVTAVTTLLLLVGCGVKVTNISVQ